MEYQIDRYSSPGINLSDNFIEKTDKIDHLAKIRQSGNLGNFDSMGPFTAIALFSGSPPSSTVFIYSHAQKDYRHVHVHPKLYRAYKITQIEIRFISSR